MMTKKEEESQKITLKEVLDLLGLSEVDGLLTFFVLDLGVSSVGQQDLDDLDSLFLAGDHQGGPSIFVLKIKITSQTNQSINDSGLVVVDSVH